MKRFPFCAVLPLALMALLAPTLASAVTFYPNITQDLPDANPGDGVCSYLAVMNPPTLCTLRAAVMEGNATPLDQDVLVHLVPGAVYVLNTPEPNPQGAKAGDLDITRPMRVGTPEGSVPRARIDANDSFRAFELHPNATGSTIYGIEIANAFVANGEGAAIRVRASGATLENIDVHHSNSGGEPGLPCAVTASDDMTLIESRIHHNGSDENFMYGVCSVSYADVAILRSTLDHNAGNGVDVQFATLYMENSTATLNEGSGVNVFNASGVIRNSTVAKNHTQTPAQNDGEIEYGSNSPGDYNLHISGSIVDGTGHMACAGNHVGDESYDYSHNIYSDDSCYADPSDKTSIVTSTINLSELGDWGGPTPTMLPLPGSDAIDQAPAIFCNQPGIDQRGLPRPVASVEGGQPLCDIGAVELTTMPDGIFFDGFEGI